MYDGMRGKIKSEQGATLVMALLFFVICAAIGAVVLTGATAVAGRAAGTGSTKSADADQQYYSLESAARLIMKQLEDQYVFVLVSGADEDSLNTVTCSDFYLDEATGNYVSAVERGAADGLTASAIWKNMTDGVYPAFNSSILDDLIAETLTARSEASADYVLHLSGHEDGDVTASLVMSPYTCDVSITLSIEDDTSGESLSDTELIFRGVTQEYTAEAYTRPDSTQFTAKRMIVSWDEADRE